VSRDALQMEFEIASGAQRGARLALHSNRLVQWGGDAMETIVLAQIASVRVAFERDARRLGWGLALLAFALVLALVSGPLQRAFANAMARSGDAARAESLDTFLHGVFNALAALASLLPGIAGALVVAAAALLVYYWLGKTTLTLAFGATERVFAVRGRNRLLVEFGEALGERLAARGE
jgi:hypothetical protein